MSVLYKYDYGQTVRLAAIIPTSLVPGTRVDIVGMRELRQECEIFNTRFPAGTHIYTIEYADGTSVEVPESFVESV